MNCCNGWTMECFSCVREAALIYCNYYDHSRPGNESNDKIGPCDENSDKCDIKQGKRVSGQIEWVLKWLTPAKQCQAALSYEPSREILAWKSDLDCPAFFLFHFIFIVCLLLHSCCVANLTSPSHTCTASDHVRKQGKAERRRGREQLRQHWLSNQAIWNCSDWKVERRVDHSARKHDFLITLRRRSESLGSSVFVEPLLMELFHPHLQSWLSSALVCATGEPHLRSSR